MVVRALGVAGVLLVGTACCPIPVPRQVTVRPALTVTVVDASGRPADATLTVRRYVSGPPPDTETHRWTAPAPGGHATLDGIEQSETMLPLMMHGVPWYSWQICAVGPAGAASTTVDATAPIHPTASVSLTLDAAATDCGWRDMTGP